MGASLSSSEQDIVGGRGGDALSESTGTALGASRVEVYDRAVGGQGGGVNRSSSEFPPSSQAGSGGSAWSTAFGSNQGDAEVLVSAEATGGAPGLGITDQAGGSGRIDA